MCYTLYSVLHIEDTHEVPSEFSSTALNPMERKQQGDYVAPLYWKKKKKGGFM